MPVTRRSLLAASPLVLAARKVAADSPARPAAPTSASPPPPAAASPGPVRLLANENPYGMADSAKAAAAEALATGWQYPFAQVDALRKLIATREGVAPGQVLIGTGSGELLCLAAQAFTGPGRGVVAARPTFTFLQDYARRRGAGVTEVPLDAGLAHDLPALEAATVPGTGLLYLCNPNNPTGTRIPGAALRPFVARIARRTTVLVDEAYLDLADDAGDHSCVERVRAGDPVIVTRTFSKLHGMAGLRIGYALASAELIGRLEAERMTILNLVALAAATASYQDTDYQATSRARIRAARDLLNETLDAIGWRRTESFGNFVFFDTGRPVADLAGAMRSRGFLVGRPFPPYDSWCRVSLGTLDQTRAFATELRRYAANAA